MITSSTNPSIKTDIFDFCQTFGGILKPFAKSLESVRASIQGKIDAVVLQRSMAGFSDVHHRLESLIHKVDEQQAYLIIFGPLKSGKSTLMNAISAAYVSEVTSLPAYPCLVHVKHGDDFSFVASRYSGEKLKFADNASLQALIVQSHQTLAERLREVEERGEKFDPGVHYPDAIRRVDVAVPTRNMKDSATVLVDTPGLYTRMKFGYDLMTREFRNSAACAVFVVKTDNLFLEQVFEEFNDLLDLFSRIFIVVNIDTNKRDLDPDGSLKPSLESRSPGEVIRAFESLVMSAPLRRAQAEGRLRIYPIDLLNSASNAMRRPVEVEQADEEIVIETPEVEAPEDAASKNAAPTESSTATAENAPIVADGANAGQGEPNAVPAVTPSDDAESAEPPLPEVPPASTDTPEDANPQPWQPCSTRSVVPYPKDDGDPPAVEPMESAQAADSGKTTVMPPSWSDHPEASFALFLKDLTDYLNSSDYLQEFMGDALLMGTNLGAEIQNHCSQKATESLHACLQVIQTDLNDTEARLMTIANLESLDINASFTQLRDESRKHAQEVAKSAVVETLQKALKQLEEWFRSDASVATLQNHWGALVSACGHRVSGECQLKLRALVATPHGGIRIDEHLRSSAVGLDELLVPVLTTVRATLGKNDPALQSDSFRIEPDHLKVRKSFWDWLAFRSLASVRRKVFGKSDTLDREVTALVKEKRLGEEGRQALEERIISELSRQFPSEAVRVSESLITDYMETLGKELNDKLRTAKDKYAARQAELTQRIKDNLEIRQKLDDLSSEAHHVLDAVDTLGRKYHSYSRVTSAAEAAALVAAAAEQARETAARDDASACETPTPLPDDCECGEVKDSSENDRLA